MRRSPCACVPPPIPRWNRWALVSLACLSNDSLPRFNVRVGFHITIFGACSAFTARCSPHARRVTKVTLYTRGFSRFVTSTTAPVATGRSESCRVGLPPTERSRLSTAHVEDQSDRKYHANGPANTSCRPEKEKICLPARLRPAWATCSLRRPSNVGFCCRRLSAVVPSQTLLRCRVWRLFSSTSSRWLASTQRRPSRLP